MNSFYFQLFIAVINILGFGNGLPTLRTEKPELERLNLADLIHSLANGSSSSSSSILGIGTATSGGSTAFVPFFEKTSSLDNITSNLKEIFEFPEQLNHFPVPTTRKPQASRKTTKFAPPFVTQKPTIPTIVSLTGSKGNFHIGGIIGDHLNVAQLAVKIFAANLLTEVVPAIVSISNSTDLNLNISDVEELIEDY